MHGGGFAYRLYPSRLTSSWRQQSAQRETVSLSGRCACEERISTCGVSSSGIVKVWHGPRASQPAWNRSRAQTRLKPAPSQQHPNDIYELVRCRLRDFQVKISSQDHDLYKDYCTSKALAFTRMSKHALDVQVTINSI